MSRGFWRVGPPIALAFDLAICGALLWIVLR